MRKFLLLFSIAFFTNEYASSQTFTLQLKETLNIGEATSDTSGYILGRPQIVQVDSESNIYISERSDNTVRVFNSDGVYQHSLGGRGRGPGEFLELTDFRLQKDSNLAALDRLQSRVTIFDMDGSVIDEYSLPEYIEGSAFFLFPSNMDNQHFLAYINLMQEKPNGHFLHLFDSSFQNKISEHFDLFDTYFNASIPLEERLAKSPWYRATHFNNHHIAIVPNIFTGTVVTFDKHDLTTTVFGDPLDNFYEELNWERRHAISNNTNLRGFLTMSGRAGNFFLRREAANFGLAGNQNFLLQFYGTFEGRQIIPRVHVYSPSGTLLLNISLENSDIPFIREDDTFSFIPVYLDNNNKLYVTDYYYQGGYPAVRVFETNLDELLEE